MIAKKEGIDLQVNNKLAVSGVRSRIWNVRQ